MSFSETLVILLVAMVVLGPKRLPAVARKIGKWTGMVRRAGEEFKRQLLEMDQLANDRLNTAVNDLEGLVPSDEELGAQLDQISTELEQTVDLPPPEMTPDDAWGQAPVPGGLPPEPAPAPDPAAAPRAAAPKAAPLAPKAAVKPAGYVAPDPRPEDVKPRSLGLSPTASAPQQAEVRHG